MLRYKLTFIVVLLLCLFLGQCNTPTTNSHLGGDPKPPDWLDVQLSFEKLPNENEPVKLTFDITVTGEDFVLYVTHTGDTLDLLYMKFATSDWVVGLNADADTLWQGKVNVGTRIVLESIFQIDSALIPVDTMDITPVYSPDGDNTRHFWSHIDFLGMFYSSTFPHIAADSVWNSYGFGISYTLFFDYRTGDYHFGN
ncbi:MAG: hypothetical protein ABIJ12_05695 [bacterium]